MSPAGQPLDQKALRAVTGKTANRNEIAKDCILGDSGVLESGQYVGAGPANQRVLSSADNKKGAMDSPTMRRKLR